LIIPKREIMKIVKIFSESFDSQNIFIEKILMGYFSLPLKKFAEI
jgi:hypothetical protein